MITFSEKHNFLTVIFLSFTEKKLFWQLISVFTISALKRGRPNDSSRPLTFLRARGYRGRGNPTYLQCYPHSSLMQSSQRVTVVTQSGQAVRSLGPLGAASSYHGFSYSREHYFMIAWMSHPSIFYTQTHSLSFWSFYHKGRRVFPLSEGHKLRLFHELLRSNGENNPVWNG